MKPFKFLLLFLIWSTCSHLTAQSYSLFSPNKKIEVKIKATDKLYYAVDFNDKNLMWFSELGLKEYNGQTMGQDPKIIGTKQNSISEIIQPVWGISSEIKDEYNEMILEMKGNYNVVFRAYDYGVAYRFQTQKTGELIIENEIVNYRFLQDHEILAHVVGDFQTSYEKLYTEMPISKIEEKEFISLPLLVNTSEAKVVITESDVYDYPGLYLMKKGRNTRFYLDGLFPQYPTQWEQGGWQQFNLKVTQRANYLSKSSGSRNFPWRVMIIAEEEKNLLENDLVYQLARPSKIETDWIKPGKVAWDWWNDWNLKGVDFETGVNNKTYEYYIDFAAKNGIEYIIMDEGWSDQFDLFLQKPGIDVPYLVNYAKERGVGVILWAVWYPLDRQMMAALDQFEKWGVAGLKVDFIDRDDQIAVAFYERLASECAKRKLLLDYHGCSKPTGLHRTYPNLINYEGVRGNEYNKFSTGETPTHNIDIVYTRMLAGPMDYTPGAMRNSTQGNFQTNNSNPMSYGTRAHQLAMYVVYYSPLQMLCDAPTAYTPYPDILDFLSKVPVTWEKTIALQGKLRDYVAVARRSGTDWYVGAMTNWEERTLSIELDFLDDQAYEAVLYLDGLNANRNAEDYRVLTKKVTKGDVLELDLKKGGGAVVVISRE